eukprot:4494468-Prymnesium_polylepis.1
MAHACCWTAAGPLSSCARGAPLVRASAHLSRMRWSQSSISRKAERMAGKDQSTASPRTVGR